jgi:serine/threonine protein kinase
LLSPTIDINADESHRDLHKGNVLVVKEELEPDADPEHPDPWESEFHAVLADLGESGKIKDELTQDNRSYGYHLSRAPEVAWGGNCTPASDIFALGCLIVEILKTKEQVDERLGNKFSVPGRLFHLALTCLNPLDDRRLTAKDVFHMCWNVERLEQSGKFDFWRRSESFASRTNAEQRIEEFLWLLTNTEDPKQAGSYKSIYIGRLLENTQVS